MGIWTWCFKCGERTDWQETHRDDEFIYYKCGTPHCGNVKSVRISGGTLRERLAAAFASLREPSDE